MLERRHKDTFGYIKVKIYSENPYFIMVPKDNYILEHRLIMAQHLKRPLSKKEIVHHNNCKNDDNRIENLRLFKGNGDHQRLHSKLKREAYQLLYSMSDKL